jgi:hypothetical protein
MIKQWHADSEDADRLLMIMDLNEELQPTLIHGARIDFFSHPQLGGLHILVSIRLILCASCADALILKNDVNVSTPGYNRPLARLTGLKNLMRGVGGKNGPRTIVLRFTGACGDHTSVGLKVIGAEDWRGRQQEELWGDDSIWLAFCRFGVKVILAKEVNLTPISITS